MQRCTACDHIQFVEAGNCERCGAPLPALPRESEPNAPGPASGSLEAEVIQLAAQRGKIEAIKRYRQATNASLKDAKDAVEALMARYQIQPAKAGCAGVLLLVLGTLSLALIVMLAV